MTTQRATQPATHRQFIYVRAPDGMPDAGSFRLVEAPMPSPADGQVLVRTHYLSIDLYMRRQMGGGRGSYAGSLRSGEVMIGLGAGFVIESRHPNFRIGDPVQGEFGWREHVVLDARGLRKLPADLQPLSLSLGPLGQSGATAVVGLVDMAAIKAGETVIVSATVGSAAGQIARIKGCRTIGAGGAEECRAVVADLGFDAAIDYKAGPIEPPRARAAPDGVDAYFRQCRRRHPRCRAAPPQRPCALGDLRTDLPAQLPRTARPRQRRRHPRQVRHRAGFRIGDHLARRDQALDELMAWFRAGRLQFRETVAEGFDAAPPPSSTCCPAATSASSWCAWPRPPRDGIRSSTQWETR
jgi:NADPH-dependent curcumin reductase